MAWFGVEVDGSMVAVRAVHFTASATTAGALLFRAVVADPAPNGGTRPVIDAGIRRLAWAGLSIAFITGMLWLLLQASAMSGQPFGEAVLSGAMGAVINETQFGLVSKVRLGLALLLGTCLAFDGWPLPRWLALGSALGLVAAIAWTGHAASTPESLGYLHVAADGLHLWGAAAWIGGLMSLALLVRVVGRYHVSAGAALQLDAVRRFSSLGIASVATLVVSGTVNAWILVGSFRALFLTAYGWILMVKIAAFVVMVALAAVNRLWLTPRLAKPDGAALRSLMRNTVAEIVLALFVFALVGLLGTLHPAAHLMK
jgi:putative copper resistance protein D